MGFSSGEGPGRGRDSMRSATEASPLSDRLDSLQAIRLMKPRAAVRTQI